METLAQSSLSVQKVSRMGEMVLVILGGIFGLMAGGLVFSTSGLFVVTHDSRASEIVWRGVAALLGSVLALVLLSFLTTHSKLTGWLLIVVAVGGLITAGLFYVLPGLLLFITGLMCLLRGGKQA